MIALQGQPVSGAAALQDSDVSPWGITNLMPMLPSLPPATPNRRRGWVWLSCYSACPACKRPWVQSQGVGLGFTPGTSTQNTGAGE